MQKVKLTDNPSFLTDLLGRGELLDKHGKLSKRIRIGDIDEIEVIDLRTCNESAKSVRCGIYDEEIFGTNNNTKHRFVEQ